MECTSVTAPSTEKKKQSTSISTSLVKMINNDIFVETHLVSFHNSKFSEELHFEDNTAEIDAPHEGVSVNLSCRVRQTYQAELVTMWEKGIVALTPSEFFRDFLFRVPIVLWDLFQKQLSFELFKTNLSLPESERNYTFFSNGQVLQINNYSRSLDEGVYHCKVFDRRTGSMISKQIKIGL